jgi:hypothetical protein
MQWRGIRRPQQRGILVFRLADIKGQRGVDVKSTAFYSRTTSRNLHGQHTNTNADLEFWMILRTSHRFIYCPWDDMCELQSKHPKVCPTFHPTNQLFGGGTMLYDPQDMEEMMTMDTATYRRLLAKKELAY